LQTPRELLLVLLLKKYSKAPLKAVSFGS
jgi:hypothetical protein